MCVERMLVVSCFVSCHAGPAKGHAPEYKKTMTHIYSRENTC